MRSGIETMAILESPIILSSGLLDYACSNGLHTRASAKSLGARTRGCAPSHLPNTRASLHKRKIRQLAATLVEAQCGKVASLKQATTVGKLGCMEVSERFVTRFKNDKITVRLKTENWGGGVSFIRIPRCGL